MTIKVVSNREPLPEGAIAINTTSCSRNWSRKLSPFWLPAGHLYGNFWAANVENAWQFSKVYDCFVDENGQIKSEYFDWAKFGWQDKTARRYPMGKGTKPLFSLWNGKCLDYIAARKLIYVPLYARAVRSSTAFARLERVVHKAEQTGRDVYLIDFDGYDHRTMGMTLKQVLECPSRKMGHAFVLLMLLTRWHQQNWQKLLTKLG